MTELRPVDPHDPTITAVQIARHLDDVVRALNYATRPGDPRLDNVPDAYSVLGALREALGKLPQACTQIAVALHRHETAGSLRAAQGWPHADQPREAVVHAAALLGLAADTGALVSEQIGKAQTAISGVSHEPRAAAAAGRRVPPTDRSAGRIAPSRTESPGVER